MGVAKLDLCRQCVSNLYIKLLCSVCCMQLIPLEHEMKTLSKTHSAKLEVWVTPEIKKGIQQVAANQGKALAVYLRDLFDKEIKGEGEVK